MARALQRSFLLALGLGAIAGVAAGPAAARPKPLLPPKTKQKLVPPPSCAVFAARITSLSLGPLTGPSVTTLPDHHTICSWSGQAPGHYAVVATVQITAAPAELGKALLAAARSSERAAAARSGGFGSYLTRNPRRGLYFEGMALWNETAKNKETGKCPPIFNEEGVEIGEKKAIEKEQSGPQCAGQPGTEGDFATAYGSPRGNVEPTLLQMQVAAQEDTTSEFDLGRLERGFFATGH